jgi:hypothetical protein
MKHQRNDLANVLRRSVETAANYRNQADLGGPWLLSTL